MKENVSSEEEKKIRCNFSPKNTLSQHRLSMMIPDYDEEQEESVRFAIYSPKLESVYAPYSARNQSEQTHPSVDSLKNRH